MIYNHCVNRTNKYLKLLKIYKTLLNIYSFVNYDMLVIICLSYLLCTVSIAVVCTYNQFLK